MSVNNSIPWENSGIQLLLFVRRLKEQISFLSCAKLESSLFVQSPHHISQRFHRLRESRSPKLSVEALFSGFYYCNQITIKWTTNLPGWSEATNNKLEARKSNGNPPTSSMASRWLNGKKILPACNMNWIVFELKPTELSRTTLSVGQHGLITTDCNQEKVKNWYCVLMLAMAILWFVYVSFPCLSTRSERNILPTISWKNESLC